MVTTRFVLVYQTQRDMSLWILAKSGAVKTDLKETRRCKRLVLGPTDPIGK